VLIYQWYAQDGVGVNEIVRRLEAMGAPSPGDLYRKRKTRKYGQWNHTAVYNILTNPTYKGQAPTFRYKVIGKTATKKSKRVTERPESEWMWSNVPALVNNDLWEAAQVRLAEGRQLSPGNTKYEQQYLLARRIRCACSYGVRGAPAKRRNKMYWYYRCHGKDT